jgi:tetratricopeptide (TPR) repeat protein
MLIDSVDLQLGVPGLGERHREALEICIDHGLRQLESKVRNNLGTMAYYAGRWQEAAQWYRSGRQVALEAGGALVAAQADVNLAELLINLGSLDEAEESLIDAIRVLRASGAVRFLAEGQMQLARAHLSRGELAEAERRAAEVAATFAAQGNYSSALEAVLVQAEAMIAGGRAEESLAVISDAERAAGADAAFSMPRICLQRGRALVRLQRVEEAQEAVTTGIIATRAQELPYEAALLLRVSSAIDRDRGLVSQADAAALESQHLLEGLGVQDDPAHPTTGC